MIPSPSPSIKKFTSWAGTLLKIWGLNPALKGHKIFCPFSVHFQILNKKLHIFVFNPFWISCFTNQISIKTFSPCFIWFINNKTRYQKMSQIKHTQFCVKNLKIKRKKDNNFMTFRSGDLNHRFQPMVWIFMESVEPEINSKQASKRDRTLLQD